MQKSAQRNETIIAEFILLGFGDLHEKQILLFLVLLAIYIMTMTGNLLILLLVVTDQNLHTPMYFFLGNLSCLETCYSSTILPGMLASFLTENRSIPITGCIAQLWVFGFLAATECNLLAAMSYDRYIAICRPLHYSTLMNAKVCLWLVAGSWVSGFVVDTTLLMFVLQLTFCGDGVIEHFFCDLTPLMKLTCSDSHQVKMLSAVLSSLCTLPPFVLTITSYVYIISAILRITSTTGRQKAFSTCSSHLAVVTIFYSSLFIVYVLPDTKELRQLNKFFSVFYTILTPLINPLIYSLRNKEVKQALRRTTRKCENYLKLRVHCP